MPDDLIELMKSSDVTNITQRSKLLAERMFAQMTPKLITDIQNGVQKGIDAMNSSSKDIDIALSGVSKV